MTPTERIPLLNPSPPENAEPAKRSFLSLAAEEFDSFCLARNDKPSLRSRQIWSWLARGIGNWEGMTDLSSSLRSALAAQWDLFASKIVLRSRATDLTEKLLLEFPDAKQIETVLMREENRRTICLSTQVGCGMGCVFCASGLEGMQRNLQTSELFEQILRVREILGPAERLSHIVVMGMGEPLANLERLLPVLDWACSEKGLGISARNVTISTVGLPKKIVELASHSKPYHLAVSLHAPNDALRNRIVPTNQGTGLEVILDAAQEYQKISGRQVTYEYILLAGVNDHSTHADELGRLLTGRKSHVNLIPFNPVSGLPWKRPSQESIDLFRDRLRRFGVTATVRKRKGADIDAACGQLRREAARTARVMAPPSIS